MIKRSKWVSCDTRVHCAYSATDRRTAHRHEPTTHTHMHTHMRTQARTFHRTHAYTPTDSPTHPHSLSRARTHPSLSCAHPAPPRLTHPPLLTEPPTHTPIPASLSCARRGSPIHPSTPPLLTPAHQPTPGPPVRYTRHRTHPKLLAYVAAAPSRHIDTSRLMA